MRSFIKKDLLIFWRDRKELATVLILPILLVLVLNFAFAGLFSNNEQSSLDLQLAVVNQDDVAEAMARLNEKLVNEASLGDQEAKALVEQANDIHPVQLLFDFLESEDLNDWVTVHKLEESVAVDKVKEGDLDAILIIPDGFTAESLYAAFVGESPATTLEYKLEKETSNSSALYSIIHGFIDHLNYQFAIQEIAGASEPAVKLPEGGFEKIGAGETFTMTQYFTVAMGALFALFLVATVATKTGVEIREQVFNRILLTNSHPMHFLIGKMVSTICLVLLQIIFVMIVSHFILDVFPDRSITFWIGLIAMVILLSLVLSGLAAVFTAISLRVNDIDAANGIFMLVILLFGIIGGNFVPIYILPNWLQQIGEWTPNGLFLVMLTDWIQFEELSSIVKPSILLTGIFLLFTMIGLALFPQRGKAK
ncbi:ABC transporter permease [Cytobacillus purgationiresistens]|uniref:ABC-2 type transport system permease protein n=1 Tax=Cytobacillus purgationiresistens TaxID=863449 RepID=A0ABU0ATR7_9BACI|nr:ABC transporter permease [Cytobacillus purgationiresistens]MDQ0273813.1 ABC-2 type transport system permease protein [Cytobacillus purgationiresistens]